MECTGVYVARPNHGKMLLMCVASLSLPMVTSMHNHAESIVGNHCDALFGHVRS